MVLLPCVTNGQQQSFKRSSNTVNKTSKKKKSTQREVSPQHNHQIAQTEFALLLKRIADMEAIQQRRTTTATTASAATTPTTTAAATTTATLISYSAKTTRRCFD
jgi:hypothetical protein